MRIIQPQPGFTLEQCQALLTNPTRIMYAELYTLTPLRSTLTMRSVNRQRRVDVTPFGAEDPEIYRADGIKVTGFALSYSTKLEVDEYEMGLTSDNDPSRLFGGMKIGEAAKLGRMDGTEVRRERLIGSLETGEWMGVCLMFRGKVTGVRRIETNSVTVGVKSDLYILNNDMPRQTFQPGCSNTFGDSVCGIDRTALASTGTIGVGSTDTVLIWAGAANSMKLGTALVPDGLGGLVLRSISSVNPGVSLTVAPSLGFMPTLDEDFEVYPGCERTATNCEFYSNKAQFRGFPFIPSAETAY